jgi:hypothetical protein
VLVEEIAVLVQRRRNAGLPAEQGEPATIRATLTGLALSGGGVRSASFNLGLLQALYRADLLRWFDYLSTVSGGGYIGSFLCGLANRPGVSIRPGSDSMDKELGPPSGGPQTARIRQLVRGGDYLNHPLRFANHYLLGLVLNNLAIFTGLVFCCALAAWLWRLLDTSPTADWLLVFTGGWVQEANRPFLPAIGFLALWLLVCAAGGFTRFLSNRRSSVPWMIAAARALLAATVVCTLVGLAVLLSTPSVRVGSPLNAVEDGRSLSSFSITHPQQVLWKSLLALISASLLPLLLRPRQLVEGWLRPTRWYQPWLFYLASTALLVGVPFLLIFYLAGHDLSRSYSTRGYHLSDAEIFYRSWREFWKTIEDEAAPVVGPVPSSKRPATRSTSQAEGSRDTKAQVDRKTPGAFIWGKLQGAIEEARKDGSSWEAASKAPVPPHEADQNQKQKLINCLNKEVIRDPSFYRKILSSNKGGWLHLQAAHHGSRERLFLLVSRASPEQNRDLLSQTEVAELNRLLLEVCYPQYIWEMSTIRRQVRVRYNPDSPGPEETCNANISAEPRLIDCDQQVRLWLIGLSGGVFVIASVLVNLNLTSLHSFYRDQLRQAFLTTDPKEHLYLAELKTQNAGAPYPMHCCALNRLTALHEVLADQTLHHNAEPTDGFLLSPLWCGSRMTGYTSTRAYLGGQLELDDAMAISAAAFTPAWPRVPLLVFLLTILNLRLGQWLSNPDRKWASRLPWPCVLVLLLDLVRRSEHRRYVLITDGGHYDNLGIWPLLQRRCWVIVASDATCDPNYEFTDLLKVVRRARVEEGIEIQEPLPLDTFRAAGGAGLSAAHGFAARILYPAEGGEPVHGVLIVLKSSVTGDEPSDLLGHRDRHRDFPHEPTENQIFDEAQYESYRQLGEHIGNAVAAGLLAQLEAQAVGSAAPPPVPGQVTAR